MFEIMLSDKRSASTRHAYAKDLRDFFRTIAQTEPTPEMVNYFLQLSQQEAVTLVLRYKGMLLEKGLAESTINRRLSAIKSLVRLARSAGQCNFSLEEVKGEKAKVYRDTTGVSPKLMKQVFAQIDRKTLAGSRDYAIMRLLWDNALRREEIASTNVGSYNADSSTLKIIGKGKRLAVETIDLSAMTRDAIFDWLWARKELKFDAPLFISLDPVKKGSRITGAGIYWIVDQYFKAAGVKKKMSPHRIRHSSITAALDATNGNIRKVQKLSRHSSVDTLLIYDDNRLHDQLEMSDLLSDMI